MANAVEIDRVTEQEQRLVAQLQADLRDRQAVLQAKTAGCLRLDRDARSIFGADNERDPLLQQIERTRRAVDANRQESWVIWIVARQSLRLFGDVLDLIALRRPQGPDLFLAARN